MKTHEIDKIVHLGNGKYGDVFCRIAYKNGRLSITGSNLGSYGQISSHLSEDVSEFAPGWDTEAITKFAQTWDAWHLNDMRPGCEHQRAEKWGTDSVEVVTYGLTKEALTMRRDAEHKAIEAARNSSIAELSEAEKFLISGDWFKDCHSPPDADSPLSGLYEVKRRETRLTGWVRQDEHPAGVLSKPCPVCGYRYGSAWLREEVPADILEYLESLPEADKTLARV